MDAAKPLWLSPPNPGLAAHNQAVPYLAPRHLLPDFMVTSGTTETITPPPLITKMTTGVELDNTPYPLPTAIKPCQSV